MASQNVILYGLNILWQHKDIFCQANKLAIDDSQLFETLSFISPLLGPSDSLDQFGCGVNKPLKH